MPLINSRNSKRFSLHSISIEIIGDGAHRLAKDFDYFTDRTKSVFSNEDLKYSVILELVNAAPKAKNLPRQKPEKKFEDCAIYRRKGGVFLNYFAGAHLEITRHDFSTLGRIVCNDSSLTEEIGFIFLRSELARLLEKQGLHRINAVGIILPTGKSALILTPKNISRNLLALEILKHPHFRLLSNDAPLVDRLGNIYPFPLRLAFKVGTALPNNWMDSASVFEGQKESSLLIPISALSPEKLPRPNEKFKPNYLLVASRGQQSKIQSNNFSRVKSAYPLVRDLILGFGEPRNPLNQLEQKKLTDIAPILASRLAAATSVAGRSKAFQIQIGDGELSIANILVEELASLK